METLNNTQVYYSLGNEYTDYDLVDTNHIRDMIVDRFQKQKSIINDKHLYKIQLSITPTRIDYHEFDIDILQGFLPASITSRSCSKTQAHDLQNLLSYVPFHEAIQIP